MCQIATKINEFLAKCSMQRAAICILLTIPLPVYENFVIKAHFLLVKLQFSAGSIRSQSRISPTPAEKYGSFKKSCQKRCQRVGKQVT